MNVFIYSPKKAPLLINGAFSGAVGPNVRRLQLSLGDHVEVDLGDGFFKPRCAPFDNFSENMSIIDLYEGFLLLPTFKKQLNVAYSRLFFKSIVCAGTEYLFTVTTDGEYKLSCQGYGVQATFPLPFCPKDFDAAPLGGSLILVKLKDKLTYVLILSATDLSLIFEDVCDNFVLDGKLLTEKTHRLIGLHTEKSYYTYKEGKVLLDGRFFDTVYPFKSIPKQLLPLCFLEKVRLSADYRDFLSEELKPDHKLVADFLGKFSLVIPPFLKDFADNYLLIGEKPQFVKIGTKGSVVCEVSKEAHPF